MSKVCNTCKNEKLSSEFHKDLSKSDGLAFECKECVKLRNREYRKNNRDKENKRHRKYQKDNPDRIKNLKLKSDYGITLEQYDRMFEKQKGCCAICKVPQAELPRALCVDHDHQTKEVRGLLCPRCNKGLGSLKDSIALVEEARKYLSKYSESKADVVFLDRRAFLSVIGLSSQILDALSEELEMFRSSKGMPPEVREALGRVTSAHLANMQTLSFAIQNCVVDPLDPEGTRPVDLQ